MPLISHLAKALDLMFFRCHVYYIQVVHIAYISAKASTFRTSTRTRLGPCAPVPPCVFCFPFSPSPPPSWDPSRPPLTVTEKSIPLRPGAHRSRPRHRRFLCVLREMLSYVFVGGQRGHQRPISSVGRPDLRIAPLIALDHAGLRSHT